MSDAGKIVIRVPGDPKEKGRHRSRWVPPAGGRAGFIQNYPDPDTASYESLLAVHGSLAMRQVGLVKPLLDPLCVTVIAFRRLTSDLAKWEVEAALDRKLRPTTKPDLDNLVKVLDALNSVVWKDDSQIVDLKARKFFSDTPELVITVEPLPVPTFEEYRARMLEKQRAERAARRRPAPDQPALLLEAAL